MTPRDLFKSSIPAVIGLIFLFQTNALYAEETNSWFFDGSAGVNFRQPIAVTLPDLFDTPNGVSHPEIRFSPGVQAGLDCGYNFNSWASVGLGVGYVRSPIYGFGSSSTYGADFDQIPIMANVLFTRQISENWSAYLGGGLGANIGLWDCAFVFQRRERPPFLPYFYPGKTATATDCEFGYDVMLGLKYSLNHRWDFSVGYKLLATPENSTWTDEVKVKASQTISHSLSVALTCKF